jgi:threonine synthase
LLKEVRDGRLDVRGKTVVCVVTGHGLKDPDSITARFAPPQVIPATMAALERLIGN